MGGYNRALGVSGYEHHIRPTCSTNASSYVRKSVSSSDGTLPMQVREPLRMLEQVVIEPEMVDNHKNATHACRWSGQGASVKAYFITLRSIVPSPSNGIGITLSKFKPCFSANCRMASTPIVANLIDVPVGSPNTERTIAPFRRDFQYTTVSAKGKTDVPGNQLIAEIECDEIKTSSTCALASK